MQKRTKDNRPETRSAQDGPSHAEDLALKSAAAYFGEELIHWLGIRERIVRPADSRAIPFHPRI